MKRREVLKALSVLGAVSMLPPMAGSNLLKRAEAVGGIRARDILQAKAVLNGEIGYTRPSVMPQIINVFMYGGPSELAGNLTNIHEIDAASQNPFGQNDSRRILRSVTDGGRITQNNFWSNAGGDVMEASIRAGDMSIYRTMMRRTEDSRAHRTSIVSNQTGMPTGNDTRPGVGTTIAGLLAAFDVELENPQGSIIDDAGNPTIGGAVDMLPVTESLFPLVTFEGDSFAFNSGGLGFAPGTKPMSLNQNLNNPYSRNNGRSNLSAADHARVEALANTVMDSRTTNVKIREALEKRAGMEAFVGDIGELNNLALPADPDNGAVQVDYGNTTFARRLKAAVTLALYNPSSTFIALNTSGGLGGWDDHNSAEAEYPGRMQALMVALQAAGKHIRAVRAAQGRSNNIIINCYGEFGRIVNLNDSMGWDHGNQQNLYTVGGSDLPGRGLGRLVGETVRTGREKTNRQLTAPAPGSYEFEPASIAASLYKYLGVTEDSARMLAGGAPVIDETGQTNLFV